MTINEIARAGQIHVFAHEKVHTGPLGHTRVTKSLLCDCHDMFLKNLIVTINKKFKCGHETSEQ